MSTDRVGGSGIVRRHKATHATGGTDALTPADIGAAATDDVIVKALISGTKGAVPVGTGSTVAALSPGSNGQTLVADSSQTNGLRYVDGTIARNAVVNGSFAVWQRGTSFVDTGVALGSGSYTADRWIGNRGSYAAGCTVSRQTGPTNFRYCARVQRTSGNTSTSLLSITTPLETVDSLQFAGKTVSLSFYARAGSNFSASSLLLRADVSAGTGTDQNIVAGYTGYSLPISQSVTLTTSWQRFTVSGTIDASTTELSVGFIYFPTGTAGANDWFEVTGVQLETGPVATPFEFEPYEATLRKCQRYYARFGGGGDLYETLGGGVAISTTVGRIFMQFPVTMRVAPTAVGFSSIKIDDQVSVGAGITAVSLVSPGRDTTLISCTVGSGLTQYRPVGLFGNDSTSAHVSFSAEL